VPAGDRIAREMCASCGHIHYVNPTVLVSCILFHGNKLLWIKRSTEPYAGRWSMPGGFMEEGERPEETACRELYEETRLILLPDRLRLYGVTSLPGINQVYLLLVAPLPSTRYELTSECSDIRLATENQTLSMDLPYPSAAKKHIHSLYTRVRNGTVMGDVPILTHFTASPLNI
jgi:ADP-ribose pyrophosphatase YjhB (NUDIX family)